MSESWLAMLNRMEAEKRGTRNDLWVTQDLLDGYISRAVDCLVSAMRDELTQAVLGLPMTKSGEGWIKLAHNSIDNDYNTLIEWARQYRPEFFNYRMF